MSDKYSKRIIRYLEDLAEEKEDLFENADKLICTANYQAQSVLSLEESQFKKETVVTFLTKTLLLFSEVNSSILKYLQTVQGQEDTFRSKENEKELNDYLKGDCPLNLTAPFEKKPLDNVTLKAICSTLINEGQKEMDQNFVGSLIDRNDGSSSPSTIYCESEVQSTVNSISCSHPLYKFQPAGEIPKDYDQSDIDKVKENMMYISRKMGFDTDGFVQASGDYEKSLPRMNFHYENPDRDVSSVAGNVPGAESELFDDVESDNKETSGLTLNNGKPLDKYDYNGPSLATGAVRKLRLEEDDLIDFSSSTTHSDYCLKVSKWLTSESNKLDNPQGSSNASKNSPEKFSAVKKLAEIKCFDLDREIREKAIAAVPDLKFVPVEPPQVIVNDLCKGKKEKVKDFNKEIETYDLPHLDEPLMGAVCVFSHIVSPSEFYLQLINETNTIYLDMILDVLKRTFDNAQTNSYSSKSEACTHLGKFCCGQIWDGRFYRLKILDWKLESSNDEVDVQSVDFGFKSTTVYKNFRILPAELRQIPVLAMRCHFYALYPPGSTYVNRLTQWNSVTTQALCNIANLNQNVDQESIDINLFKISYLEYESGSFGVDLTSYPEISSDTLGQLLVDMGLAIPIQDQYGNDMELGGFLQDVDELEKAENVNEFLLGYDAKDEARICKWTRKDGTCYKGKNCKLEHIQLKDGFTTDKTAEYFMATNQLLFPEMGQTVKVLITAFVDSCTYFAQVIRDPVQISNTKITIDRQMADLMDAMNHPKIVCKYEPFKINPALTQIVLALHPILKTWMRVSVVNFHQIDDGMSVEVLSVDFGEKFLINRNNLRMMREDFMHVPFQAFKIYLGNCQQAKNCDIIGAKKFFQKHIAFKAFMANIESKNPPFKVSLTTFKGKNIGPILIKEKYAECRTVDDHLNDDYANKINFD